MLSVPKDDDGYDYSFVLKNLSLLMCMVDTSDDSKVEKIKEINDRLNPKEGTKLSEVLQAEDASKIQNCALYKGGLGDER